MIPEFFIGPAIITPFSPQQGDPMTRIVMKFLLLVLLSQLGWTQSATNVPTSSDLRMSARIVNHYVGLTDVEVTLTNTSARDFSVVGGLHQHCFCHSRPAHAVAQLDSRGRETAARGTTSKLQCRFMISHADLHMRQSSDLRRAQTRSLAVSSDYLQGLSA